MKKNPVHHLACYLFKKDITKFDNLIKANKTNYRKIEKHKDSKMEVEGYLEKSEPKQPKWLNKLKKIFDINESIFNNSNSFILFVKSSNRIFAFTMGHAHHAIDKSKIEYDFGLKVALNKLNPNMIRAVDVKKLSLSPHQKREITSSNSKIFDFDCDFDEEFIDAIMGRADDVAIANSIQGRESLKVSVEMDIAKIDTYCTQILKAYEDDNYKKNFAFVDKLKINKDKVVFDNFEKEVKKALLAKETTKIALAYPNIEHIQNFNYKLKYGRLNQKYNDINVEILFSFFDDKKIDLKTIELQKINIALIGDDDKTFDEYNILDYLVFEFDFNGKKFLYSSNKIFEIDRDYYKEIVDDIKQFEKSAASYQNITIPKMYYEENGAKKKIENEGDYNLRFEKLNKSEVVCLDKKNFTSLPGHSQIEICDILTQDKKYICVKTYKNSSAVLSHLFMQAKVSAELLNASREYRLKIQNLVKSKFTNFIDINKPNRTEITFVYAIAMLKSGSLSDNLPFFSKISLRQSIKFLERMDYKVELLKIELEKITKLP